MLCVHPVCVLCAPVCVCFGRDGVCAAAPNESRMSAECSELYWIEIVGVSMAYTCVPRVRITSYPRCAAIRNKHQEGA